MWMFAQQQESCLQSRISIKQMDSRLIFYDLEKPNKQVGEQKWIESEILYSRIIEAL